MYKTNFFFCAITCTKYCEPDSCCACIQHTCMYELICYACMYMKNTLSSCFLDTSDCSACVVFCSECAHTYMHTYIRACMNSYVMHVCTLSSCFLETSDCSACVVFCSANMRLYFSTSSSALHIATQNLAPLLQRKT